MSEEAEAGIADAQDPVDPELSLEVEPKQPSCAPPPHLLRQASVNPRFVPAPKKGEIVKAIINPRFVPAPKKGETIKIVPASASSADPEAARKAQIAAVAAAKVAAAKLAKANVAQALASGVVGKIQPKISSPTGQAAALMAKLAASKVPIAERAVAAKEAVAKAGKVISPVAGRTVSGIRAVAEVSSQEPLTLYLDEVPMLSRPQVPPTPFDREVFVDPIPAEDGSEELQEWLKTFGEVEEIHRLPGQERGYFLFKDPVCAAKCVGAYAGTWSESERAVTGQKSARQRDCAYPDSLIFHFLGKDGANVKEISKRLGMKDFQVHVGSAGRGQKGEASRVRFVANGTIEQLTMLRREIEEQLQTVHDEISRLIDDAPSCKVIAKGFAKNASVDDIRSLFAAHEVIDVEFPSSGHAVLEFSCSADARRAATEMDGQNIDKSVTVEEAVVLRCTLDAPWYRGQGDEVDTGNERWSGQNGKWDNGNTMEVDSRPKPSSRHWHDTQREGDDWRNQSSERREEQHRSTPPSSGQIEDFIATQDFDDRCKDALRQSPPEVQAKVLSRGGIVGARNPSGALMARIRDARKDLGLQDEWREKDDRSKQRGDKDDWSRQSRERDQREGWNTQPRGRDEREEWNRESRRRDDKEDWRRSIRSRSRHSQGRRLSPSRRPRSRSRRMDDRRGHEGDEWHRQGQEHGQWEKMYDPNNDAYYYFNHVTGESSWYPPEEQRAMEAIAQRSQPRPSSSEQFDGYNRREAPMW